jgi:molybdate transport system ATP-binding protein
MPVRAAAVVYTREDDVDAVLAAAVQAMSRAGMVIGGLLQRAGRPTAPGKREMLVRILPDGETICLSEPRGPGVQGCVLDTDALTRAAMAFRHATLRRPDLLLANRFGKQEAAGEGLRAELAEAIMADIPLLVPVRAEMLPDWRAFFGEPAQELPPTTGAILDWAWPLARDHVGGRKEFGAASV